MWMTHSFEPAVRPLLRHHSARVPGRDISGRSVPGHDWRAATLRSRPPGQSARLNPTRSRSLRPQVRRALSAELRVGTTVAAS